LIISIHPEIRLAVQCGPIDGDDQEIRLILPGIVALKLSRLHTEQALSPVAGKVVKVHSEFESDPDNLKAINTDPYGEGWIIVIESKTPNPALLSAADYKAAIAAKSH